MNYLIASFVVATISMTLTKGSIFKSFRDRLDLAFAKKLFNCPYCMAHWIAAPYFLKFGINAIGLVALSSIWSLLILTFLEKLDETIHDPKSRTL